jgi:hypothetical protein
VAPLAGPTGGSPSPKVSYGCSNVVRVLEVLRRMNGLVDQAAEHAVFTLSSEDLAACLRAAHVVEQRVAALRLACVRELDGRGVAWEHGDTSTAAWLREQLRISPSAARRMVRLAAGVGAAPQVVGDAFAAGVITVEQTWVIVRTIADLPAHAGPEVTGKAAQALVDHAGGFDPLGLGRIGQRILWHVAPDLAEEADLAALRRDERRARLHRHVTLSSPDAGLVRLSGLLDAETAGLLHAAIDPLSAPTGDGEDDRTPGQRRHDALADLCRLVLGTGDLPESGGDRPQVVA